MARTYEAPELLQVGAVERVVCGAKTLPFPDGVGSLSMASLSALDCN
jgi:hypothetical protein